MNRFQFIRAIRSAKKHSPKSGRCIVYLSEKIFKPWMMKSAKKRGVEIVVV